MFKRLTLALLLVALAGCSLGQGGDPAPTAQPTTPPIEIPQGGTLTVRMARDVGPLRPWAPASHEEEQMVGLLYRGLTRLDASLLPRPDIASSWASDASGRTLTMTLRPDLRWHDGEPLTAADAAWTITTLRSISPTTPLLADLRSIVSGAIAPVSTTLIIQLS
ncbi:MAG TPA: ABC transporter substrate-binding protein, partial [Herpetosiphonaceae bacterium]|nr:ABC transporter substrate-binding protein [Herpetosiphonaceae bacterium]